ncbi:BnaA07g00030D [Brassica napus]|uniref:BnaA07g00030D protein n=1 Tax=Brassica napus TaxID=3708 RepID=A0A078H3D4_BRANA|nr:BnaA07g00030D [Brassica napus]
MRGSSPAPTSSPSSPATRRGKKNGSEKPKQPQRGLGVAQLEKIRLHGEMSCNSFNNYNPSLHLVCKNSKYNIYIKI